MSVFDYVWDFTKMDIVTPSNMRFDGYRFSGLPDKKPNPNLFPYRSILPNMNPNVDRIEDDIPPNNFEGSLHHFEIGKSTRP